jgi:outer membrane protein assembly factor BamB
MKLLTAALLFCSVLFIGSCYADLDWPMVNGCRERTSWAEGELSLSPPFDEIVVHETSADHVTCVDNVLYLSRGSTPSIIAAYDVAAGIELWSFEMPGSEGGPGCVPAVGESLVYCGGYDGMGLHAVDRFTGEQRWLKEIGSLYTRNPILDNDRVYVVQDSLYCLDSRSGETVWTYPISGQNTPAVDETQVYAAIGSHTIALDKLTGEEQWYVPTGQRSTKGLCVDDEALYTVEGLTILSRNKNGGQVIWEKDVPNDVAWLVGGGVALSDAFLCYVSWQDSLGVGRITALEKSTGGYLWHYSFEDEGVQTPTIANGIVYVVGRSPRILWGFDLATGVPVFSETLASFYDQPVVADHALYVTATASGIYEFRNAVGCNPSGATRRITLEQNYPNPCRDVALIPFHLEELGTVRLTVIDMTGRVIRTVRHADFSTGRQKIAIDTSRLSPGTYIYRLEIAGHAVSRKLTVLR